MYCYYSFTKYKDHIFKLLYQQFFLLSIIISMTYVYCILSITIHFLLLLHLPLVKMSV